MDDVKVMQIGNIVPPRKGFSNPQEGRVYSVFGIAPCIRNDSRYYVQVHEKDNPIR